ncbi:MAG: hypothetical protein ACI4EF_08590 [Coprococcus sp.]
MIDLRIWQNNLKDIVDYPWECESDADHPDGLNYGKTLDYFDQDDCTDFHRHLQGL